MFRLIVGQYNFTHPHGVEIERSKGTDFYLFVLFTSPAEVRINGQWLPARDRCILYEPFHEQHYRSVGDAPYTNDFIDFFCDDTQFFKYIDLPLKKLLNCADLWRVRHAVQHLHNLRFGPLQWRSEMAEAELTGLFYHLSAQIKSDETYAFRRYLPELSRLRNMLYSQPQAGIKVAQLADHVGLSASYFQSVYKSYFNVSIGEDIILGRLERARYLLSFSIASIEDVAQLSGYESVPHFIRQFKKYVGITPGRYRRSRPSITV